MFETIVRRTRRLLRDGDNELELRPDVGEIVAGEERSGICELELEIRQGSPTFAFDLALELLSSIEPVSRFWRDE